MPTPPSGSALDVPVLPGGGGSLVRAYESFSFAFDHVETALLPDVARAVLHTILFQRALGHVRPASIVVLEREFPCLRDAGVERFVEEKVEELARLVETRGKVRVALLQTPLSASRAAASTTQSTQQSQSQQQQQQRQEQQPHQPATSAGAGTATADKQATARTGGYPYAWITHAWSGGITGTTVHRPEESAAAPPHSPSPDPTSPAPPSRASTTEAEFEEWAVTFTLVSAQTERERNRLHRATSNQLANFVRHLIRFTDEKRLHIPSITTNDLEPFPIKIDVERLPSQ